ncbi:MAG: coproporphyrinogen-III oxidase family protein [Ilumatobacteraceae bacterium]
MTDFGVYVHVPFCRHRCDYCAFATFTDRDHLMVRYVEAVRAEVRREIERGMKSADTVFFGGGTPSRLAPELLMSILDVIPRTSGAEVTVECNPDDVSLEMFRVFADHGVNRISFGVQSMQGHVLASLGRTHDPDNVRRGVDAARGIGLSFNLDVIYGAHGETVEDWERTVHSVVALDPPHVSAYGLTVEA